MTPTKSVSYAYPSSKWAARFGHAITGCYVVEGDVDDGPNDPIAGFETLEEAETFAEDRVKYDWSPSYLARPLPGSRFA